MILACLLLVATVTQAKKLPGYVVFPNNDTLHGEIKVTVSSGFSTSLSSIALNYRRSLWRRLTRELESRRWFEKSPSESPQEKAAILPAFVAKPFLVPCSLASLRIILADTLRFAGAGGPLAKM